MEAAAVFNSCAALSKYFTLWPTGPTLDLPSWLVTVGFALWMEMPYIITNRGRTFPTTNGNGDRAFPTANRDRAIPTTNGGRAIPTANGARGARAFQTLVYDSEGDKLHVKYPPTLPTQEINQRVRFSK